MRSLPGMEADRPVGLGDYSKAADKLVDQKGYS